MKNGRFRRALVTLAVLAGMCTTGCAEQAVLDAARTSMTSFLTSITNQAITAALSP